jgi:hypothetical protein
MVTGFRINAIGNLFTTTRRIRASKTVSESIELWKAAKAERKKAKKKEKKLDKRRLKD